MSLSLHLLLICKLGLINTTLLQEAQKGSAQKKKQILKSIQSHRYKINRYHKINVVTRYHNLEKELILLSKLA